MALFAIPMIPRDGKLTFNDGTTPTALTNEVLYEEGDFQAGDFNWGNYDIEHFGDRGEEYASRRVKRRRISWTFTAHATDFTDATEKTLVDMVCKQASCSTWKSTKNDGGDMYTLGLTFAAEQSNYGAGADSTVVLKHNVVDIGFAEGVPGKFTIKGTTLIYTDSDVSWT